MVHFIWLIPFIPFFSSFILGILGPRWTRQTVATLGVGSISLSFLVSLMIGLSIFFPHYPRVGQAISHFNTSQVAYSQTLWSWIQIGDFKPAVSFYLDPLSWVMTLVVCFVGVLIHFYSTEFMAEDSEYSRFFSYMNLFVGAMLTLILADNLLLLYLGWEGVGLCSYLLIGFWYRDLVNVRAARKAFLVTRVGDTVLAIGIFLLFTQLGTIQIQLLLHRAEMMWSPGSFFPVLATALLLGGAVGKSAQLPLQVWLPDSMVGPTPVSALIHAATMVTAGVYLIARTHLLFQLAPVIQMIVGIVGALTLLLAGFSALTQSNIKRILAYSTMSQIGYMFLALGVGAWPAAIFHLMTHAFFKALLFLSAGAVIFASKHEHNIFKMGGLYQKLPVAFWSFLIGAASLAAVPWVTAGFYSKDLILEEAYSFSLRVDQAQGIYHRIGFWFWLSGVVGAFLTSVYIFRLVFIVFFGHQRTKIQIQTQSHPAMDISIIALSILSIVGGIFNIPKFLNEVSIPTPQRFSIGLLPGLVSLVGIGCAYLIYLKPQFSLSRWVFSCVHSRLGKKIYRYGFEGWGFDRLYHVFLVLPWNWLAKVNPNDFIDLIFDGIADFNQIISAVISFTQTGSVRWYAMGIAGGIAVMVAVAGYL